jgi:predicted DsbA family dithiol-disulfide isomerase
MTLEELFSGRSIDIDQVMERLQQVAAEEGLPLGVRKYTYNSRLAQELSKWAEYEGKGRQFHHTIFDTYFAEGKNIGRQDILVEAAQSVGLSGPDAQEVLEKRTFKEAVDMDWIMAKNMGITAVPTFVIDQKAVVGAQPYEMLEKFLQDNNVPRRLPND